MDAPSSGAVDSEEKKTLRVFNGPISFDVYHDPKEKRVLMVVTFDGNTTGLPMRPNEVRTLCKLLLEAAAAAAGEPSTGIA